MKGESVPFPAFYSYIPQQFTKNMVE